MIRGAVEGCLPTPDVPLSSKSGKVLRLKRNCAEDVWCTVVHKTECCSARSARLLQNPETHGLASARMP
jgi:hypothetical protein